VLIHMQRANDDDDDDDGCPQTSVVDRPGVGSA
jgi:hypothetical protein